MLDQVRVEHFRNLVSLIAVDGKIEDIERITLSKIAYERGIPLDRFNVMLTKAHEYQFLIPQNHLQRETQLQEMIEVAKVDGEFAPAELELIKTVASKLGFNEQEFATILNKHR